MLNMWTSTVQDYREGAENARGNGLAVLGHRSPWERQRDYWNLELF